jgi:uncharacterized tellurite resistance protein B-like protein
MLRALRRFFETQPTSHESTGEHDLHLAAAVLLLEVSRADFDIDATETAAVARALRNRFHFTDAELDELLELARDRSNEAHSLFPYLRQINERFSLQQKARMIEDLWHVAYADGSVHKYEEHHIRRIADLLYVPHSTFIRTKHLAQASARSKISEGERR